VSLTAAQIDALRTVAAHPGAYGTRRRSVPRLPYVNTRAADSLREARLLRCELSITGERWYLTDLGAQVLGEQPPTIESLQAEIERLRAVLQQIATTDYRGPEPTERRLARQALHTG